MNKRIRKKKEMQDYLPPFLPFIEHPPRLVQLCNDESGYRGWAVMSSEHIFDLVPREPDEEMKAAWQQIIADGEMTEGDLQVQLWSGLYLGIHRWHEESLGVRIIEDGTEPPPDVAEQFRVWPPTPPPAVERMLAQGEDVARAMDAERQRNWARRKKLERVVRAIRRKNAARARKRSPSADHAALHREPCP